MIPKGYIELDRYAIDGIYTENKNLYPNMDMTSIIKYSRENNINSEDLTNEQLKNFCIEI